MKKIFALISTVLLAAGSVQASGEGLELNEMHAAAETGIAFLLEQTDRDADDVRGYSIGQVDDGASLRVFFKDGSQNRLFCHFHHHGSHDHEDIDCHIQ